MTDNAQTKLLSLADIAQNDLDTQDLPDESEFYSLCFWLVTVRVQNYPVTASSFC